MDLTVRKKLRLDGYDYSTDGFYFITFCTLEKQRLLSNIVNAGNCGHQHIELTKIGEMISQLFEEFNIKHDDAKIDIYTIMPNHIHMILKIQGGTPRTASPTKAQIPKIINAIKSLSSKKYGGTLWQRGYYDHIIRDDADYLTKWNYIDTNPTRWADDEYYTTIP